MAISQRLVDLLPRDSLPTYKWQALYQAALLETDWMKIAEISSGSRV